MRWEINLLFFNFSKGYFTLYLGFYIMLAIRCLLFVFISIAFFGCGKNDEKISQNRDYFSEDEEFFYVKFLASPSRGTSPLFMKFPKEFVYKLAPYRVSMKVLMPNFHLPGFRKPDDYSIFLGHVKAGDNELSNMPELKISMLSTLYSLYYPKAPAFMRSYSYVGESIYGLSHYKWKGCEGKPFDKSLLRSPSFDGKCYSLNRSEYYLSPRIDSNGRAVRIKCSTICVVDTSLRGYNVHYVYPAEYLKYWKNIDSYVHGSLSKLIIDEKKQENTIL